MYQYEQRFYRSWVQREDLCRFQLVQAESDLLVLCDHHLESEARVALAEVRAELEDYLAEDSTFATSLVPHEPESSAPAVARAMASASRGWDVGPMAAVAGAVAEHVGRRLARSSATVIVENGGDVFAIANEPVRFALYAGADSPFSNVGFEITPTTGVGVCTSSGRVGPSLSFGCADAVVAIADDALVADAAATAIANQIKRPTDIDSAIRRSQSRPGLRGLLACAGDRLAVWGEFELVGLAPTYGARS